MEPASSLNARYSDIDINGHVNSIRYIEHILDLFPIELYKESRIRRFEMAYVAESYYGDELTFIRIMSVTARMMWKLERMVTKWFVVLK